MCEAIISRLPRGHVNASSARTSFHFLRQATLFCFPRNFLSLPRPKWHQTEPPTVAPHGVDGLSTSTATPGPSEALSISSGSSCINASPNASPRHLRPKCKYFGLIILPRGLALSASQLIVWPALINFAANSALLLHRQLHSRAERHSRRA